MMRWALEVLAVFGAAVALLIAGAMGEAHATGCAAVSAQTVTWSATDHTTGGALSYSSDLLTASLTGSDVFWESGRATVSQSTGKWYFEVTFTGSPVIGEVGLANASASVVGNQYLGEDANSWAYDSKDTGEYFGSSNSFTPIGGSSSTGEILGVAVDLAAGKVWFSKNGTWLAGGNPATGVSPAFAGLTGVLFPAFSLYRLGMTAKANYGASAFASAPPAGFSAWNSVQGTCSGQFVCTAPSSDASGCTAWTDIFDSSHVATFDEVGVTGEAVGVAFAFGCGMVLVFVGFGLGIGSVSRVIKEVLGDRYT